MGEFGMKKLAFIFVMLVSVLVLAACGPTPAQTDDVAAVADLAPDVNIFEGKLAPASWLEQSFAIPGQVAEVLVQDGEEVEQGQVLARLVVPADVELTLARAQQELLAAQQALDSLRDGAELALAEQRMAVIAAEKQVETAQEKIDDEDSEENQASLVVAVSRLERAQAILEKLEAGDGVDPDVTKAAQMRLKTAEASLAAAEALQSSYELRATTAGTVVDPTLQVGQRVTAGQPVFTLADFSVWMVKTDNLTEVDIANVDLGEKVTLFFDALADLALSDVATTGKVVDINMRSEEKRGDTTYTVTIQLDREAPGLCWGMTATVHMEP
jgi:multidrug resistance efflux pump